jgi:RHS repeat-associated protein
VNNTTTYGYDAVDRLITDTNQLNKTRTRSYDNVGNLTQTTDRNGRTVAYNYDTLNRQTSERWLNNNGTIKTFSASYDAVGHLVSSINSDSSYAYTYDGVDRVTSIDNAGTVGVPAVKFNYGYDAVGNLLTVNDSINGTSAGITGYSYDLLNRVIKLTQSGAGVQTKRVDMAYNAVNQLTSLSRFSGVNSVVDTNYTYDLNQRLIQLSHKKGASTVASYDYNYDASDKLASTVSSSDGTSSYSYDATNQLTGASHSSQTNEAYSYDANGNRTSGGTVTGVNNQLLNDGTYSYTYDGEGNRTKRVEIATGKITEYNWDYRNRLTAVLFKDASGNVTKTIEYLYDGNNQRIGKRIDGAVTERYVIDRNQIALVFDGAGSQTHRYLYGTQIDQILADETATSMVWALADNQGTIRDLIDDTGNVVSHINYDSFGRVVSKTGSIDFRYGYTGREQDGETGLDYYRARYYDAGNGRFISEDPLGFGGGDRNLTRYVRNNAVNAVDSSGLVTETYIHSGSHIYGHTAINVNGTVYTFGRYPGAEAVRYTGGTIGEGILYKVDEQYYLNSKKFTDPLDTVNRYRLNLSPEEEEQVVKNFEDLFNNQAKKGTDIFSPTSDHRVPVMAHGRKLKQNYNILSNSCNTTTLLNLPQRVQTQLSIRAVQTGNNLALKSPPNLDILLSTYTYPRNTYELIFGTDKSLQIERIQPINPGERQY